MKNLLLIIFSVVVLTSCGLQRQVNELKNRQAQSEIDSQHRDAILQQQINILNENLTKVDVELKNLDQDFAQNNETIADQNQQMRELVASLQNQQILLTIQIAAFQGYTNIVDIINPCGVQAANEEIFLKLSSGKFLASFSDTASGQNTRFTLLSDGNRKTTDGTNCFFTVSENGTKISNQHN